MSSLRLHQRILKLAILNERRIEFTGEGKRWSDIHRLGLPSYGIGGVPNKGMDAQLTGRLDDYKPNVVFISSQRAFPYKRKEFI